jgi:hypothetical protein
MNFAGFGRLLIESASEKLSKPGFDLCVVFVSSCHIFTSVFAQLAS